MKQLSKLTVALLAIFVSSAAIAQTPTASECKSDYLTFRNTGMIVSTNVLALGFAGKEVPVEMKAEYAQAEALHRELIDLMALYFDIQAYLKELDVADALPISYAFNGGSYAMAVSHCGDMYRNEFNKEYGMELSPVSDAEFSKANWICHTSFKQALAQLEEIVSKYRALQKS